MGNFNAFQMMDGLDDITLRVQVAAALAGVRPCIPDVRRRVAECVSALNPYGCNQYGEGWASPHNGTSTRYVEDKDGKRRKEVTRADGGGEPGDGGEPRTFNAKMDLTDVDAEMMRLHLAAIRDEFEKTRPEVFSEDAPKRDDFQTWSEWIDAQQAYGARVEEANKKMNAWRRARNEAAYKLLGIPEAERGKFTMNTTATVRGWGKDEKMREQLDDLARFVNPDRISGEVNVKASRRADDRCFFRYSDKCVYMHPSRIEDFDVQVSHETVHMLEHAHPEMNEKSIDFMLERAASDGFKMDKLRKLYNNNVYKANEVAFIDHFAERGGKHYAGKIYLKRGVTLDDFEKMDAAGKKNAIYTTDVLTMGAERIINDPLDFAKEDPDYFKFVLKTLRS